MSLMSLDYVFQIKYFCFQKFFFTFIMFNFYKKCIYIYFFLQVLLITFNLWFRLSEELYKINNAALTDIFKPYFEQLIGALYKHCMIDTDHVSIHLLKFKFVTSDFNVNY